jgi:hypothetical protein
MRDRQRILDNLEKLYRNELERGAAGGADVPRLDFEFQRDQIYLEVMLDLRDLLGEAPEEEDTTSSLLDKAQKLRNLTRLR